MIKNKMPSSNQVLIEHFDSKFDLLLDGYAMTNKKIDDLINGLRDEANERFDAINERFAEIDDKFEAVFDVLDDIKNEMKSVKI
jgi:pyridoxal/pyridoxine/pyridoxamine kinase